MPTSACCWDFGRPSVGADAAIRTPRPQRLPCAKGAVSRRLTEGLSCVDGPFGGDLCRDSHPFLRTRWRRRFAVRRWPGQSRRLSATTRRARRHPACRPLVPPQGVGADAYIGPSLGTTCAASVGRGDLTPPSVHSRSPCRGRAPSRPVAKASTQDGLVGCGNFSTPRRGGPMCPPLDGSREEACPGRHTGRPLQISYCDLHRPQDNGRGQSPAPTDSIAASINPGKQDAFPQNPQTNSPFSIPPSPQFSPASCKLPFPVLY